MPEITQEELEQFNRYKELGAVDEVSNGLNERQTMARERVVNEAAGIVGFKTSVLTKLSDGVDLQIKEGVPMIGDVKLEDYAKENWADFLPSLKAEGGSAVPFVRQPSKATQPTNNSNQVVSSFLKRTYGASKTATVN